MTNIIDFFIQKIYWIPGILIGFTVHEYAHAYLAVKLGDKTPKFQGRLTLNPLAHIDIIGFLLILVAGFGWAKPVEINPHAFKNGYKDDLKVSLAGPLANLITALICSLLLVIINRSGLYNIVLINYMVKFIQYAIYINCLLFVFNLMPIPGLDGFHIVRDLFPDFFFKIANDLYRLQMIILILFILPINGFSIAQLLVGIPVNALFKFLITIANL